MIRDSNRIAFLELLKASLFQHNPAFPSDLDWAEILDIAKKQTVVALAAQSIPVEYTELWKKDSLMCISNNVRNQYEQKRILDIFQSNNIPVVVIKGTSAAMYYPEPYRRTMGDIDLLVPGKYYDDAKMLLMEDGFQFKKEDERNSVFIKRSIILELHYRFSSIDKDIEDVIREGMLHPKMYQIGNFSFPGLPPYVNGLVLLDHVRQHLVGSGLGCRQVIDWMMFVHTELNDEAWMNNFKTMAQDAGLETLAITLTKMCKQYLGLPDPITWCDEGNSDLCEMVLECLFSDGNFGRERPATEIVRRDMKQHGTFQYLQYAGLENWNAAQKHSFLRPFAWIYQIYRYFRKGIIRMRHGDRVLGGFSAGAKKDVMLKRLGI